VVCLNKDDWYRILQHLNKTKFFKKWNRKNVPTTWSLTIYPLR
jgi:hypothetical protein